ncbi:MAG: malonate decarboxylase subunit epsilon [Bryobacteraceae bacterium]
MSLAFLFPGQGSQYPGMFQSLPNHPAVTRTFEEATEILNQDVQALDGDTALVSTIAAQLAIFIAGVSVSRVLEVEKVSPDAVAGLSIGAFGAAVASGAIDFDAALPLVRLRAELMERAYASGYGLSVIIGLTERQISQLIEEIHTEEAPVFVATVNAPQQVVIAGADEAMNTLLHRATEKGATRAENLPVSVPSHCPLLRGVAERLLQFVANLPLSDPRIPYVSNTRGRILRTSAAIRQDLATNVMYPVRWHDAVTVLVEVGVRLFVELPPGHVLTGLVAAAFPGVRAISLHGTHIASEAAFIRRTRTQQRE